MFDHESMHINSVENADLVLGLLRGWCHPGIEEQSCRNRMVQAQCIAKFTSTLRRIFTDESFRIRGVISQTIAQLDTRVAHLELHFAKLSVPLLVVGIRSQHVVC